MIAPHIQNLFDILAQYDLTHETLNALSVNYGEVLPVIPLTDFADTMVVPLSATQVTRPLVGFTVATLGTLEVHVKLRSDASVGVIVGTN